VSGTSFSTLLIVFFFIFIVRTSLSYLKVLLVGNNQVAF